MWFVNTCKIDLHIHHYIYFASKTKRELSTWDAMIVQNKTELQKWRMVKIVELVFWVFTFITVFNNIFITFYYVPHDETHASSFFFFFAYMHVIIFFAARKPPLTTTEEDTGVIIIG